MIETKPTPGITGFTDSGSTIAIHAVVAKVIPAISTNDKIQLEMAHNFSMHSLMNDDGAIRQIVNIYLSTQSLQILSGCIHDYLDMVKNNEDWKILEEIDET